MKPCNFSDLSLHLARSDSTFTHIQSYFTIIAARNKSTFVPHVIQLKLHRLLSSLLQQDGKLIMDTGVTHGASYK